MRAYVELLALYAVCTKCVYRETIWRQPAAIFLRVALEVWNESSRPREPLNALHPPSLRSLKRRKRNVAHITAFRREGRHFAGRLYSLASVTWVIVTFCYEAPDQMKFTGSFFVAFGLQQRTYCARRTRDISRGGGCGFGRLGQS